MSQDKFFEIMLALKKYEKKKPSESKTAEEITNIMKAGKSFAKIEYDGISALLLKFYLRAKGIDVEVENYLCKFGSIFEIGEYSMIVYADRGFLVKGKSKKFFHACSDWFVYITFSLRKFGEVFTYDIDNRGISVLIEKESAYIKSADEVIEDTTNAEWKDNVINIKGCATDTGYLMHVYYKEGKRSVYVFIEKEEVEQYLEHMILMTLKS